MANNLILFHSYDFFKAELLKTPYFEDNIMLHFTASFAAVCHLVFYTAVILLILGSM